MGSRMRKPAAKADNYCEVWQLLLAFIAGWVVGSVSLYSYLMLTAKESPHPECMDCHAESCEGCSILAAAQQERYRVAA